jgi:hypothetical protein
MIHRVGAIVGLAILLAACSPGKEPAPAASEQQQNAHRTPPYSEAPDNVLSLGAGAVVIDRTGEANLDTTPLHVIDGQSESTWSSPGGDPLQSATFAFPALTRVESFGVSVAELPPFNVPKTISIEGSSDGQSFHEIGRVHPEPGKNSQWFPLTPSDITTLRVNIVEVPKGSESFTLQTVEARGKRLQPAQLPTLTGEWQINEKRASFRQQGRDVEGVVQGTKPMHIRGSLSGNVLPFVWTRVNQAGYGILTVNRESNRLSGIYWYEAPIALFSGGGWFGERRSERGEFASLPLAEMIAVFLQVKQLYPTFQVHFDERGEVEGADSAAILEQLRDFAANNPRVNFQLNAQYFGRPSMQENRRVTDARVAAMRRFLTKSRPLPPNLQLGSIGGEVASDPPRTLTERVLYDRVELQAVGRN